MPETERDLSQTVQQVRRMLIKGRWAILVTTGVVALGTVGVLSLMPDRYRSEATLVVVQQQVSEKYVDPSSNTAPFELINGLSREVLSRTRLLAIIDEFGLYLKEKQSLAADDLVEIMRKDVVIEPIDQVPGQQAFTAFRVGFAGASPRLAYDVTSRLTSLFIEGNTKTLGREATATTDFLGEQIRLARQKLLAQEARLNDFKSHYLGELPEQQSSNLGVVADLRSQLQGVYAGISRTQQQRLYIEQQRAGLQASITTNLNRLQAERTTLLNRFTARHPDVVAKEQEIAKVQGLLDRLKSGNLAVDRSPTPPTPDELTAAQLKSQMEASQAETDGYAKEEARLKREISRYEDRLNLAPVRDQQLKAILRDYDVYNKEYGDLVNNQLKSQMTSSLEQRQEGRQFRMIDAPTLPVLPFSPKRLRIAAGGVGGGIVLGIALAFLLNMRDSSFFSEKILKQSFPMPIVVGIPMLLTPKEERWRRWKIALECVSGGVVALLVLGAEYYVYTNH